MLPALLACGEPSAAAVRGPAADAAKTPAPAPAPDDAAPDPRSARWIAIGGGAVPESTQVQIEQDIGLAIEVLTADPQPGEGLVLFGAGEGAAVVQVQLDDAGRDPIGIALADLFAPRGGRNARYRAPQIRVDAPASADQALTTIGTASASPGAPLLVFIAGHGEMGERPRDNSISLWASSAFTVHELAAVLDRAERTTRVVATTCFSGGFAELAFVGAAEDGAAPSTTRCGFFASTWDLEASGCDPNPDRKQHEGYALHFLEALRGRDREGAALASAELDLDKDGTIGLLDAHTHVVIASKGPDVPTTTSERWLRAHAPKHGASATVDVREDEAVIAALAPRLALGGHEADARERLAVLERRMGEDEAALERTRLDMDDAFRLAAAELLARWPVLDDPWHPEFAGVFHREREQIGAALEGSAPYAAFVAARDASAQLEDRLADLAVEAAPLERLVRALDNRELAGRLAAAGGPALAAWQRLRACERLPP